MKIIVNGYDIRFNSLWKMWMVSHSEIGSGLAAFCELSNAIDYCKRG